MDIGWSELQALATLDVKAESPLTFGVKQRNLSAPAYHSVLKLARAIADVDEQRGALAQHVAAGFSGHGCWLGPTTSQIL